MSSYEAERAEKIARNKALLQELQLENASKAFTVDDSRPSKKRKIQKFEQTPSRSSARLASVQIKPSYNEDEPKYRPQKTVLARKRSHLTKVKESADVIVLQDAESLRKGWTDWTPTADPPTRTDDGTFHFERDDFYPNKSPAEMLNEGVFGGTYFRPLFSKRLGLTIEDDWHELLPPEWLINLNVEKFLTSPTYDSEVNKYRVASGQSIEEWEANGWINHQFDPRGWFQWYINFYRGRRCEDDDRQISRWKKCVGVSGRWKRSLLKKYVQAGIRTINDEGLDDMEGVSPVIHQTCLHWAFEVKQDDLDQWWNQ